MNYLLVLPNYKAIGFEDLEKAKAYLNLYHEMRVNKIGGEEMYAKYDMYEEKSREDISKIVGAYEEIGKIYSVESLIENIQKSGIFEDEKEEIIKNFIQDEVKFNIDKYDLDEILTDTKIYD